MTEAPPPARADPRAPAPLREGLDALAALDPEYDVTAGLGRFEATLAEQGGGPPGGGTPKRVAWVVAAVLVVGGAAAVARYSGTDAGEVSRTGEPRSPTRLEAAGERPPDEPLEVSRVESSTAVPGPIRAPGRERTSKAATSSTAAMHAMTPAAEPSAVEPFAAEPSAAGKRDDPHPRKRAEGSRRGSTPGSRGSSSGSAESGASAGGSPAGGASAGASPAGASSVGDDALAREMKLLNAARKHVAAGRHGAALGSIQVARRSIDPRHFDEEWDALEILALAGSGRLDRAERLASPFVVRHPQGRFNASIEQALERARRRK